MVGGLATLDQFPEPTERRDPRGRQFARLQDLIESGDGGVGISGDESPNKASGFEVMPCFPQALENEFCLRAFPRTGTPKNYKGDFSLSSLRQLWMFSHDINWPFDASL